jgi:predicted lipoprotein with Yx(FWY)xxD motif
MSGNLVCVGGLAVAVALAAAGCGSSSNSSSSSASSGGAYGGGETTTETASTTPSGGGTATVAVITASSVPKLGKVIVDSKGFTLYDFHKDKGTTPTCFGPCAKVWPALTTSGSPKAGEGAMASKLGTTKRTDGTTQVTYAGHPVYTYVADTKPGEAKGNDLSSYGAQWYALKPSGEEAGG